MKKAYFLSLVCCLLLLAGCQAQPAGSASDEASPAEGTGPTVSVVQTVQENSQPADEEVDPADRWRARFTTADEEEVELDVEALLEYAPTCPDCGRTAIRIHGLTYGATERQHQGNCRHGGYPYINDSSSIVTGEYDLVCDGCGWAQAVELDKRMLYCRFLNEWSVDPFYFPE